MYPNHAKRRMKRAHSSTIEMALIRGDAEKTPSRYAMIPDPVSEYLGAPPAYLNAVEFEVWNEMKKQLPWTKEADRICFEFVVQVRALMILTGSAAFRDRRIVQLIPLMLRTVQHLGGSPVSRKGMNLENGIPTFGDRRRAGDYDHVAPYFS